MKFKIGFLFLFLSLFLQPTFGQKAKKAQKPQVLVYGDDILAFSIAVQSAKSNVPTLWLLKGEQLLPEFSRERIHLETMPHMDGGVWMDILMDMALTKVPEDSLAAVIKADMNPRLFQNAVDKVLRDLPQLTVLRGEEVLAITAKKKSWEVKGLSKHVYTVRTVVDASAEQHLDALAGISWDKEAPKLSLLSDLSDAEARTLVASGAIGTKQLYGYSLKGLLAGEKDGFLNMRGVSEMLDNNVVLTPFRAAVGQAIGAAAAYLAFFKTTADRVDTRKLQSELLSYGGRIVPFQDIDRKDPNFYALQRFVLAGVLPGLHTDERCLFRKDKRVTFAEIEPVFDQLYTRSQLWFLDNKGNYFRWKDFLSLVEYVGLQGDNIEKQIKEEWRSKLHFGGNFDPEAFVNRYQFAVILDRYANAYVKTINQEGKFVF